MASTSKETTGIQNTEKSELEVEGDMRVKFRCRE